MATPSSIKKGTYLVVGTSNKSELYVGYFTKGGDQVHDIEVISDFTVSEVVKIGEFLGVPKEILYKEPSDGLSGKTDEESLQFSYKELDKYIREGIICDPEKRKRIDSLHQMNAFKLKPMPVFDPGLSIAEI